jgi:hypothetical protein
VSRSLVLVWNFHSDQRFLAPEQGGGVFEMGGDIVQMEGRLFEPIINRLNPGGD